MINVDFTNIDNAKLIGRLLPWWARGKRISLLLQAILSPIISVHNNFKAWALEQYIFCHITSQAMSLEWYLKYKLKNHFVNENDTFLIINKINDLLSCFSTGTWQNKLYWNDSLTWENADNDQKYQNKYLEAADHINIYAPAITDTISYNHEDYARDIRNITSKFMINFNKINIIIAE